MSRSGIPVIICEHRIVLNFHRILNGEAFQDRKNVEFECVVEEVNKNYSLLLAPFQTCGIIGGFGIDGGFIDGYISSNDDDHFFGILKPAGFFRPHVSLLEITKENRSVGCSGIAFCLSFNEPRIKLIPEKYGDKPLFKGDKINIKFEI